jgi:hypothetical protein
MGYSRIRRSLVVLSSVALLATTAAITAAPVFVPSCDYTFPATGGFPNGGGINVVLKAGEVACGGPGADSIHVMTGGEFYGRGGDDSVSTQSGGKFIGGAGGDVVINQDGGVFKGLGGDDILVYQHGTFHAGSGNDDVGYLYAGGRFNGSLGKDEVVYYQYGGEFIGGPGSDRVEEQTGGIFKGGLGNDRAQAVLGGTFFGGSGADFARYVVGPGKFKAGPGADTAVDVGWNAVFNGARGNDRITGLLYGSSTYYGGPGHDLAVVCRHTANKMYDVESKTWVTCF